MEFRRVLFRSKSPPPKIPPIPHPEEGITTHEQDLLVGPGGSELLVDGMQWRYELRGRRSYRHYPPDHRRTYKQWRGLQMRRRETRPQRLDEKHSGMGTLRHQEVDRKSGVKGKEMKGS